MPPPQGGGGGGSAGVGALHLPPFSLSAPLLARVLGREWEETGESRERPQRKAEDRDGVALIGGQPESISELESSVKAG